jgi:hypothetical protein
MQIAKDFAKDMRAYFAEPDVIKGMRSPLDNSTSSNSSSDIGTRNFAWPDIHKMFGEMNG